MSGCAQPTASLTFINGAQEVQSEVDHETWHVRKDAQTGEGAGFEGCGAERLWGSMSIVVLVQRAQS